MTLKPMLAKFRSDILKQEGPFDGREDWTEAAAYEATLERSLNGEIKVAELDFVLAKMAAELKAEFEAFALQGADKEAFYKAPLGRAFAAELAEVDWEAEARALLEAERESREDFEMSESYIIWRE